MIAIREIANSGRRPIACASRVIVFDTRYASGQQQSQQKIRGVGSSEEFQAWRPAAMLG